ncbi:hypothetical protein MN116_006619 [Schistosoma mekongi]|uniref:Uncharacterized protein n=1 Tax=Schistosoma mekongi TaxID=38744 RepID=A0AAE1ZA87_SCHME|nr:hypothetical protein MN116_006619 [Schistosoma mekongi]
MYKNGYAIEKILQCKLCSSDYNHLLFWSDSICHLNNMKPTFQYLLIGQEYLYTMNYAKKQLMCRIHFSSILGIQYIDDLATFLTCQITRNYNHFCIEFIYDYKQSNQQITNNVKRNKHKCKENVKADKSKPTDLHNVNTEQHNNVSTSKFSSEYSNQMIPRIRKLHIYLTDRNFIGLEILQKALNIWYHSNKQFKNMITNLIYLNNLSSEFLTTKQSITSSSSSSSAAAAAAPSSSSLSLIDGNIETLISNATRRNTVVYSTTAINEDLHQLMSMFKPFNRNDITSSMKISNHSYIILNDNLNKFDYWITKSEMINKLIQKEQIINNNLIHLIDVQLNQLEYMMNSMLISYPMYFYIELCNKLIRIMEILIIQLIFLLPEQSIYHSNNNKQINELHNDNNKQISSIQLFNQQMQLIIHLMIIINSLLSYLLPICIQSNETNNLFKQHIVTTINVHIIVIRRKLHRILLKLIEHLIQLPCIINIFLLNEIDIKNIQNFNCCYSIELEVWIRRYEMKRLNIMSEEFNSTSQWLQETINNDTFSLRLSTIRKIFQNYTEIGNFLHQLNYQINCLFSELIVNISSSSSSSSLFTTIIDHQSIINEKNDWIKEIIDYIINQSKESFIYILDCIMSNACSKLLIINTQITSINHYQYITTTTTDFNTTNNISIFDKEYNESISTIIRSLFIIDWLTEQYYCLIELLINIGFNDYFHIFNIQYIINLTNKLNNKFTSNLPQIKLIKCVLIALVSRLHKKFIQVMNTT